jgi:hypothetical protein
MRVVPVDQKLSMIEEQRQDQICLFQRGDFRNRGQNPEKLSWVRFPVKMVFVAWKLSMTGEWCQGQNCFSKEITGTKATTPKNCPGFESR